MTLEWCYFGRLSASILAAFFIANSAQTEAEPAAKDASAEVQAAPKWRLPELDHLMEQKLSALKEVIKEQSMELAQTSEALAKERNIESRTVDGTAFFKLNIVNNAPQSEYRLDHLEVYLDGSKKPLAIGSSRNKGLPKNTELFVGSLAPGCHNVLVKATFIRLKNRLIDQFKSAKRVEKVVAQQAFIAQQGFTVAMQIEGFEKGSTPISFYHGPWFRFNNSVKPNAIVGPAIPSLGKVFSEGILKVTYETDEEKKYRLAEKSLLIDGLPIFQASAVTDGKDQEVLFNAPLSEGRHRLHGTLVFKEQKRITGGPSYNMRLNFDRDFVVVSGQTTHIELLGMPKDGFRRNGQSRVLKATSKIIDAEQVDFFPTQTCEEIKKAEEKAKQSKSTTSKSQKPKV